MTDTLDLNIVQHIYHNPSIYGTYRQHLTKIHFQHEPSAELFDVLDRQYSLYEVFPSPEEFWAIVEQGKGFKDATDALKAYYKECHKHVISDAVEPSTSERLLEFILARELEDHVDKATIFTQQSHAYSEYAEFIQNTADALNSAAALKALEDDNTSQPFSFDSFCTVAETLTELSHRQCIPTFSPRLNDLTNGGYRIGELSAVLGLMGRGKSTYLVTNSKYTACDLNKFTIHVTLDDTEIDAKKRLWACLAGPEARGLCPEDLQLFLMTNREPSGMLELIHEARDTMTVVQLRYAVEKIIKRRRGFAARKVSAGEWDQEEADHYCNLQLLTVDYADELKANHTQDQFRHRESDKFKALASLSTTLDCHVLTATQANRLGLDANTLTLANVSESLAKYNVTKLGVSLSASEAELQAGVFRVAIIKNNHGANNVTVPMTVCWESQTVAEDTRKQVKAIQTKNTPRTEGPPKAPDLDGLSSKLEGVI